VPLNPLKRAKGSIYMTQSRRVIRFMFNPTSIGGDHSWAWGSQTIPGRSHPHKAGGSGGDENFGMALWLDGDRGRSDFRQKSSGFDQDLIVGDTALSIEPELNDLRSLTLPHDPDLQGAHGEPEMVILRLGRTIPGRVCVVNSVSWNVTMFTKDLAPYKATVDVSFSVFEELNQSDWYFMADNPLASLGEAGLQQNQYSENRNVPFMSPGRGSNDR